MAAEACITKEPKGLSGFERYLTEGKAPTPELENIFEQMKQWMLDVYRRIAKSDIDVSINQLTMRQHVGHRHKLDICVGKFEFGDV